MILPLASERHTWGVSGGNEHSLGAARRQSGSWTCSLISQCIMDSSTATTSKEVQFVHWSCDQAVNKWQWPWFCTFPALAISPQLLHIIIHLHITVVTPLSCPWLADENPHNVHWMQGQWDSYPGASYIHPLVQHTKTSSLEIWMYCTSLNLVLQRYE